MRAKFSLTDIDFIKAELSGLLPKVKSSHRVEAMARGLGWKTNAALRAELAEQAMERTVDDHAFTLYLKEHDFVDTTFGALGESVVRCKFTAERTAIKAALNREPTLTRFGFGVYDETQKSLDQRRRELEEGRAQILTPHSIDEFIRAREFLSHFARRRTINRKVSSYGLKHQAEHYYRDRGSSESYVSNGALIAAAIDLGFNISQDGPNAHLNIGAQQDRPVPPHNAPGKHLSHPQRPLSLESNPRKVAWRNMMIAAINAGLDQQLFGLDPNDNHWQGKEPIYRFAFADMPAIAWVGDAGYGELVFHVAVKPTKKAEEWINVGNAGFLAGEAFAAGWLERRNGRWLQTSTRPICAFRREILAILAQVHTQPIGYLPEGRFMM